jgi:hypothetical protein
MRPEGIGNQACALTAPGSGREDKGDETLSKALQGAGRHLHTGESPKLPQR